ncbi:flagellin [Brevibacillus borstelensis]|uniref:flagellin N-terminal helical domain-containing protein n=1 Tax=Brevibacillus borstelensis TaxID=45462 RepID=UPI00148FB2C0|nr:flagellin [Brevibacillus borstelensis]NOU58028.1 flagellin [Brevibacillus borstelensis]
MRINHNIASLNTYRQLSFNNTNANKALEKLSSGLRINRAGDDAAGLAISEKMRGQIRGLEQAQRNAQDGISLIQTAEGALNETHSILQRMRELAVQADNGTATLDDRREIQKEINQLIEEIDRIATDTEFNTQKLLDGTVSSVKFHVGANQGQNITMQLSDMQSTALGSSAGSGVTGTASVQTNFYQDQAGNALDTTITLDLDGADTTTMNIVLDQDYGSAEEVVKAINVQIQGNADFNGLVEAKLVDGNKISFVNKTTTQVFIGDGSGTVAASVSLGIADTEQQITNTLRSVNSLSVNNVETATTGGVLDGADAAITVIDDAIKQVSAERAKYGAYQNRLEHTINNLGTATENLTASESRIRDVDMAKEMMEFTKQNILTQAAQAMLAQANQQPQGVLQLLR